MNTKKITLQDILTIENDNDGKQFLSSDGPKGTKTARILGEHPKGTKRARILGGLPTGTKTARILQ